ncbi:MAG: hypothetical protein WCV84_03080 [Patescibacteria group bacterium]
MPKVQELHERVQVSLDIEPRKKFKNWEEYRERCLAENERLDQANGKAKRLWLALDGRVIGPTQRDPEHGIANFNHHEGVDRSSTRSTCGQMMFEIQFMDMLAVLKGVEELHIDLEDCDQDVSTAVAILRLALKDPEMLEHPLFAKLVAYEDAMDISGGFCRLPKQFDRNFIEQINWVFEPYEQPALSGKIPRMSAEEMQGVIDLIQKRILAFLDGKQERKPFDGRYEVIRNGSGWSMVKFQGQNARLQMAMEGISAYCSFVEYKNDEGETRYRYTIGRNSAWQRHLLLPELVTILNEREGTLQPPRCWGGGDTIIGSPREEGSKQRPEEIYQIIEEFVQAKSL